MAKSIVLFALLAPVLSAVLPRGEAGGKSSVAQPSATAQWNDWASSAPAEKASSVVVVATSAKPGEATKSSAPADYQKSSKIESSWANWEQNSAVKTTEAPKTTAQHVETTLATVSKPKETAEWSSWGKPEAPVESSKSAPAPEQSKPAETWNSWKPEAPVETSKPVPAPEQSKPAQPQQTQWADWQQNGGDDKPAPAPQKESCVPTTITVTITETAPAAAEKTSAGGWQDWNKDGKNW